MSAGTFTLERESTVEDICDFIVEYINSDVLVRNFNREIYCAINWVILRRAYYLTDSLSLQVSQYATLAVGAFVSSTRFRSIQGVRNAKFICQLLSFHLGRNARRELYLASRVVLSGMIFITSESMMTLKHLTGSRLPQTRHPRRYRQ